MRAIDADEIRLPNDLPYKASVKRVLAMAPTLDVVPVVHGSIVLGHVEPGYLTPGGNRPWVCSVCGEVISWRLDRPKKKYCSECGAKLDGEVDGS